MQTFYCWSYQDLSMATFLKEWSVQRSFYTDCIMWRNCFISNYSILICNGWGSISVLCHDDYFDTSLSCIELRSIFVRFLRNAPRKTTLHQQVNLHGSLLCVEQKMDNFSVEIMFWVLTLIGSQLFNTVVANCYVNYQTI